MSSKQLNRSAPDSENDQNDEKGTKTGIASGSDFNHSNGSSSQAPEANTTEHRAPDVHTESPKTITTVGNDSAAVPEESVVHSTAGEVAKVQKEDAPYEKNHVSDKDGVVPIASQLDVNRKAIIQSSELEQQRAPVPTVDVPVAAVQKIEAAVLENPVAQQSERSANPVLQEPGAHAEIALQNGEAPEEEAHVEIPPNDVAPEDVAQQQAADALAQEHADREDVPDRIWLTFRRDDGTLVLVPNRRIVRNDQPGADEDGLDELNAALARHAFLHDEREEEEVHEILPVGGVWYSVPPGTTTDITSWSPADVLLWANVLLIGDNAEQLLDVFRRENIDGLQLAAIASSSQLWEYEFPQACEHHVNHLINEADRVIGAHIEWIAILEAAHADIPFPHPQMFYEHRRMRVPLLPYIPHAFPNVPDGALAAPVSGNLQVPTWSRDDVTTWAQACLWDAGVPENEMNQTVDLIARFRMDGLALMAFVSPFVQPGRFPWMTLINPDHLAILQEHFKRAMNSYRREVFLLIADWFERD